MDRRSGASWGSIFILYLAAVACSAGAEVNLLPNGGFEKDADGDGIADGWVAHDFNFSRQTLEQVQAYVEQFPSQEKLLEGRQVLAADGAVLYEREAGKPWGADLLGTDRYWDNGSTGWYDTLRNRRLFQNARFGEPPLPEGLDLGRMTLVLRAGRPHAQVVSEPIPVKSSTGYRLTFHVRVSGGGEFLRLVQVLDGAFDPAEEMPAAVIRRRGGELESGLRISAEKRVGPGILPGQDILGALVDQDHVARLAAVLEERRFVAQGSIVFREPEHPCCAVDGVGVHVGGIVAELDGAHEDVARVAEIGPEQGRPPALIGGGGQPDDGKKAVMIHGIRNGGDRHLALVGHAADNGGPFTRLAQSRNKQGGQDSDDRDDHQQLDQGEPAPPWRSPAHGGATVCRQHVHRLVCTIVSLEPRRPSTPLLKQAVS